jgi:hypothetical protein
MKSLLFTLALTLGVLTALAQSPFQFNFQAVARDLAGNPLHNEAVDFRLSILQGSENGTAVYIEELSTSTNNFGLANLIVGSGTPVLGSLSATDWAAGPYFLQIELDIQNGDGYQLMGTSALASVPYALHAKTSEQAGPEGPQGEPGLPGEQGPPGESGVGISLVEVIGDSLFTTLENGTVFSSAINGLTESSIASGVKLGFSESTAWVCPDGVTQITIELWGGAGGGGSSSGWVYNYSSGSYCYQAFYNYPGNGGYGGSGAYGGAGGKGGYVKTTLAVTPGETYDIVIGSGGTGGIGGCPIGVNGGSDGLVGEETSLAYQESNLATAEGGGGGAKGYVSCGCGNVGGGGGGNPDCAGWYDGTAGIDGSVVNYVSPVTEPTLPSYIPTDYLTPAADCCSQAGTPGYNGGPASCAIANNQDNNYPQLEIGAAAGGNGEQGFLVISF